jgi:DNA-binding MarR family transcriptional regulator
MRQIFNHIFYFAKNKLDNSRYNDYFIPMSENASKLKQTRFQVSREEELFVNLMRTTEALRWQTVEVLKGFELSGVQYNTLRILRGVGEDGLTCNEISERLITKDSDITRLLERLENRGFIARERDPNDRRHVITKITRNGLEVLAEIDGPMSEVHKQQLGHLGDSFIEQLNALLVLARSQTK